MAAEKDDAEVTFGVKELLSDMNDKLFHISSTLDSKANSTDVTSLRERLIVAEQRLIESARERTLQQAQNTKIDEAIAALSKDAIERTAITRTLKYLWGAFGVTFIAAAASLISAFIFHH